MLPMHAAGVLRCGLSHPWPAPGYSFAGRLFLPLPSLLPCRNVGTLGMCSKCYREQQERTRATEQLLKGPVPPGPSASAMPLPSADGDIASHDQQHQHAESGSASVPTAATTPAPPASGVAAREPVGLQHPNAVQAAHPSSPVREQPAVLAPVASPSVVPPCLGAAQAANAASPEPCSKGPSRCQHCRKKVGLTGFKCKCGLLFCGQHRYAEVHACTFDYKTSERAKLAESNPLVQADKVQRF
jgi:hypothetical protein